MSMLSLDFKVNLEIPFLTPIKYVQCYHLVLFKDWNDLSRFLSEGFSTLYVQQPRRSTNACTQSYARDGRFNAMVKFESGSEMRFDSQEKFLGWLKSMTGDEIKNLYGNSKIPLDSILLLKS